MNIPGFKKDLQYFKFCAYGFLKNLRFFEIFIMVFLLDKLDQSFSKVGVLYSTLLVTRAVLEIPSGIIADSFGRKGSMIFSYSLYISSFLVFFYADTFALLFGPIILYGIADSFRTGTHKAMIFDYLIRNNWDNHKVQYYGQTRSWSKIGSAISVIGATFIKIFYDDFETVFLYSAIPYLIGIALLASYPGYLNGEENNKGRTITRLGNSLRISKNAFKEWGNARQILSLSYFFGFHRALKDYIQPIIIASAIILPHSLRLNLEQQNTLILGLLYLIIFILSSLASRNAYLIASLIKSSYRTIKLLSIIGVFSGVFIALFVYYDQYIISGLLFILIFITLEFQRPNVVSYLSEKYDKKIMATVLSVESQSSSLIGAVLALIIGILSDLYNLATGIGIVSIFSLIIVVIIKIKRT